MATDSLTEALRGLDPARRALLDLSLRHGIRPDDLAEVLGMDSAEVVSLREDALAAIAGEGGGDVDRARTALAELPLEEWEASARSEPPAGQELPPPPEQEASQSKRSPEGDAAEAMSNGEAASAEHERAPADSHPAAGVGTEQPSGAAGVEPGQAAHTATDHATGVEPAQAAHGLGTAAGAEFEHAAAGIEPEQPAAGSEPEQAASQNESDGTPPDGDHAADASPAAVATQAEFPLSARLDDATAMNGHPVIGDGTATEEEGATTAARPEPARSPRRRRIGLAVLAACALIALGVALSVSGGNSTHHEARVATRPAPPPQVATHPAPPRPAPPTAPSNSRRASLTALGTPGSGAHGTAQLGPGRVLHVAIGGLPSARPGAYQLWLYNSVVDSIPLARFAGSSASLSVTLPPGYRRYRYLDVSLQRSAANPNPSGISVLRVPVRTLAAGA